MPSYEKNASFLSEWIYCEVQGEKSTSTVKKIALLILASTLIRGALLPY